jgi:hypothetical protein
MRVFLGRPLCAIPAPEFAGLPVFSAELARVDLVAQVARLARVRRTGWSAWVILFFLFAMGLAVRILFASRFDPAPFAPFLPAVLIATLVCGWRKSVVLLAASVAASWFFFASQPGAFSLTPPFEAVF